MRSLNESSIIGKPYNPIVPKPFDSGSPRFKIKKNEGSHIGPGTYSQHYEEAEALKHAEIKRAGSINKKYLSGIGTENREKFSLFGQIVKNGTENQLGPGSYDS